MPMLTVRLSDSELAFVKRAAEVEGVSMSALAKRRLGLVVDEAAGVADERLDNMERRLSRLEEFANL